MTPPATAAVATAAVTTAAVTVSVVVPTCRRPRQLLRCLHALLSQEGVPGRMEIIIVDDGRSPRLPARVQAWLRRSRSQVAVRCLQPPAGRRGPAAARNAGWQAARAPVIAFTDDDTLPAHDWLREGLRAMRTGVTAAWGDVIVPLPQAPTDSERNTAGLQGAEFVTANCFVRRDALAATGGFDERFERPWREDSDLYFTLLEARGLVVHAPAAIVIHPAKRSPPGTSIRQHRNLLFDALLFKKHRRLYREKIARWPPLGYYLTVFAALAALLCLLAGARLAASIAGAAWLLLTLRLMLRRLRGTSRAWPNVADIVASSLVIPIVAVFWRLAGALRYRVPFA